MTPSCWKSIRWDGWFVIFCVTARRDSAMFKRIYDLNRRRDLDVISELIAPGERVLDLGCGDGTFLRQLQERGIRVQGVELDADQIARCIANGVPVVQSDLNGELEFADDDSYDWVLLSQTLQEMRHPDRLLKRIVDIGRKAAVSVINFGHWSCRLQVFFQGRMPRNAQMPYHWYDTPNIHFSTIRDFRELCEALNIEILQETPLPARFPRLTEMFPNLFAIGGVFVLKKR